MKRLIMAPDKPGHIDFAESEIPSPLPSEALIRVTTFSVNRGEVRVAGDPANAGKPIGWDFAGVIDRPAADGSTPPAGTRVFGWRPPMDSWAEHLVAPARDIAVIPDDVSDTVAAALPVAGLTALAAIDKGSRIAGSVVLVTGVTGGVGRMALQLAKAAGAVVIAQVRRPEQAAGAREAGADAVVVTEDGTGIEAHGPYRLLVDAVGGDMFGRLVAATAKGGTLVSYGSSAGAPAAVHVASDLYGNGGLRTVYGLNLYTEVEAEPPSAGLVRLLRLVQRGAVQPDVQVERPWTEAATVAQGLIDRSFGGKAVLTVG